jgi:pimeloyl-ACP methyl ester carboxylesterase
MKQQVRIGKRTGRVIVVVFILVAIASLLPYLLPIPAGTPPDLMADDTGSFVTVDGIQTYVVEQGPADGPPIILLHGFGGSTFSWRDNINAFAEAGYRTVAFDRPGFGLSEKALEYSYAQSDQAAFTVHLMDALEIDQATLIGHSAGGGVIAAVAASYPERVERLVIVDGAGIGSGDGGNILGSLLNIAPVAQWMQVLLPEVITPERFDDLLASAYGADFVVTDEIAAGYRRVLETPDWAAALAGMTRDGGSDLTEEQVRAITAPTLIVWGEDDTWVPRSAGEQLLELLPNAQWVSYPNIGHLPMEEVPDQFNADVLAFLAEE